MSKINELLGDWSMALAPIVQSEYFAKIGHFLKQDMFCTRVLFPEKEDMFKAFKLCPPANLKVVILGVEPQQDGTANGLAWSNKNLLKVSDELNIILKEVENDIYGGLNLDQDVDLARWAEQGVLLLNVALTAEKRQYGAHTKMWKKFIVEVISITSKNKAGVIYVLWGDLAKHYKQYIDEDTNFILESDFPDKRSKFLGNQHFSKINMILREVAKGKGLEEDSLAIKW